jgi:hypothetical protein
MSLQADIFEWRTVLPISRPRAKECFKPTNTWNSIWNVSDLNFFFSLKKWNIRSFLNPFKVNPMVQNTLYAQPWQRIIQIILSVKYFFFFWNFFSVFCSKKMSLQIRIVVGLVRRFQSLADFLVSFAWKHLFIQALFTRPIWVSYFALRFVFMGYENAS